MVKLLEVVIEGFGSIGSSLTFPLNLKGINLIKGNNGVGKTTTFNALIWGLYSSNLKGVTSSRIPTFPMYRGNDFRGTRVAVYIEKDDVMYCIVRHIKFKGVTYGLKGGNTLMVFKDAVKGDLDNLDAARGNMVTDELFKKDQQEYINALMGMDYKIFINSILFGQKMARLISSSGAEKRKLLEQIFDTLWVSQAKDHAKEILNKVTVNLASYKAAIEIEKSKVELFKVQLEKITQMSNDFGANKQKAIVRKTEVQQQRNQELIAAKTDYGSLVQRLESNELTQLELQKLITNFDDTALVKVRETITKGKTQLSTLVSNLEQYESKLSITKTIQARKNREISELKYSLIVRANNLKVKIEQCEKSLANIEKHCHACGKEIDPSEVKGVEEKLKLSLSKSQEKLRLVEMDTPWVPIQEYLLTVATGNKSIEQDLSSCSGEIKVIKLHLDSLIKSEGHQSKGLVKLQTELTLVTGSIDHDKATINNISTNIDKLHKYIEQGVKDIEETKLMTMPNFDIKPLNKQIKEAHSKIKATHSLIEKATEKQEAYEFWVKKGFASTGLSSYIFSAMIDELNLYVHKWAEKVGFNIEMGIDLEKGSKPFYTKVMFKDGQVANYNELSGGEQQLIDICMAFGVHEMVSKQLPILILDEVFESLDPINIYKVFDFVRVKVEEGKGVYIITHLQDLDCQYAKTIQIEKKNHLTEIQWA